MEAGAAERAGIISPYGNARQRGPAGRGCRHSGRRPLDPVRKCAKTQIAARSAEKKALVCYWAPGLGRGRLGGGWFCLFASSAHGGGRGPELLPWGRPSEPQISNFNICSGIDGSGDVDHV